MVYTSTICTVYTFKKSNFLTSDLSSKGTARNVLVVKLDDDVVVSRSRGQVGHSTGTVFVVLTCDLSLGGTLHSQRQTTLEGEGFHLGLFCCGVASCL